MNLSCAICGAGEPNGRHRKGCPYRDIEPLAKEADRYGPAWPDDAPLSEPELTVGDARKARTALSWPRPMQVPDTRNDPPNDMHFEMVVPADIARELYDALKGALNRNAAEEYLHDPAFHASMFQALARYEQEVGEAKIP